MTPTPGLNSARARWAALFVSLAALVVACTASPAPQRPVRAGTTPARTGHRTSPAPVATRAVSTRPGEPPGQFSIAFAGDVHFAGRVAARLAANPATVFGQAAPVLRDADLTMVNLETAITEGGQAQAKDFTFRAPPRAFTALREAGIDLATMANNHGADFGSNGLRDSLAAIRSAHFPVVGIGANARQAYAPYTTVLNGVRVAIIAADQVQDETTLRLFSAGPATAGVANAFSPQLISAVRSAKAAGYVVVVYVHWGIEFRSCPSSAQTQLAADLAAAGASAVVGTHAHVLQGSGWRRDGTYVAYGLGNYLWWLSFGNNQDDNGVLKLTFQFARVKHDDFSPAHLDARGVPVPATGAQRQRILAQWKADRGCTDLSATPPR